MGLFDFLRRTPQDPSRLPGAIRADRAVELVRDGAVLVDVREDHEWRAGHARAALHIPLGRLATSTGRIPQGRPIVVVCAHGNRSRVGAARLRAQGLNATSLKGGMAAWHNAGGALV
ncbi:MAG: rhodanese-like domain-containing protein [Actinomycetales bacterium]|jgi:rhodanese-related sulfurtransferase|nr:rhodanese-like domain-containing protein [Actinomycetales bacterium]